MNYDLIGSLRPGVGQLIVICVLLILFFGNKLPSVARSLGVSVREFKEAIKNSQNESLETPPPAVVPSAAKAEVKADDQKIA